MSIAWALGCTGQGLFLLRSLVQWRASERAGRSVAPPIFWSLSIAGSLLLAIYAASRGEQILTGGYLVGAWVYTRIAGTSHGRRSRGALWLEVGTVLGLVAACGVTQAVAALENERSVAWVSAALAGQLFWNARFIVQWVFSETSGPVGLSRPFWWTSLAGNLLLLGYAAHLQDALLIVAFAFGPALQVRNLVLCRTPAMPARAAAVGRSVPLGAGLP